MLFHVGSTARVRIDRAACMCAAPDSAINPSFRCVPACLMRVYMSYAGQTVEVFAYTPLGRQIPTSRRASLLKPWATTRFSTTKRCKERRAWIPSLGGLRGLDEGRCLTIPVRVIVDIELVLFGSARRQSGNTCTL